MDQVRVGRECVDDVDHRGTSEGAGPVHWTLVPYAASSGDVYSDKNVTALGPDGANFAATVTRVTVED